MHFGIQGSGQHVEGAPDPGIFAAVAELAEALGYDSLWAGDHISFKNPILDITVALACFASSTRHISIGAGVVLLPLRHPTLVAKQFASLDYLSNGRVILGVGVGGEGEKDFEAVEIPIAERGARTDEGIAALRRLFGHRPASFDGRFYSFQNIDIDPPPVQAGGPPILIGGRTPAALTRAGKLGDGWLSYMVSADRFARDFASVRRYAEDANRDSGALMPAIVVPAYTDPDGERARRQTQEHLTLRYGQPFEPHHVERYCVAGSAEECQLRLDQYVEAGVRHIVFNPAGPAADFLDQCEALYTDVVAPVRARHESSEGATP